MEVFAYNPDAKNEALDAFNQRVAEFCDANPVVNIDVSTLGRALLLSLTLAEDADLPSDTAIIPSVITLDGQQQLTLEKTVGDAIAQLRALDSDDSPSVPFKVTLHQAADAAYAVILINGGVIEMEEPAPEPEPVPAPRGRR